MSNCSSTRSFKLQSIENIQKIRLNNRNLKHTCKFYKLLNINIIAKCLNK